MLGWYAHADIFTDAGDWVEGAVKDTEDVVESAFNSTTNWVSHNPGLAMGIAASSRKVDFVSSCFKSTPVAWLYILILSSLSSISCNQTLN
jgi:hypothetical protein